MFFRIYLIIKIFQNIDSLKHNEEELNENLKLLEKKFTDALNLQNEYEKTKKNYEEKVNNVSSENQKLKEELDDIRTESEKVKQIIKQCNVKFFYRIFKNGSRMLILLIPK